MPRYTSAYSSFLPRLKEVETLRRSAVTRERENPVNFRHEINAFCRAAVVLLCAHLEGYVKDLGEVALNRIHVRLVPRTGIAEQFYYHLSKDILDEVKDASEPTKIAEKVFRFLQSDLEYWNRIGPFPQPLPAERFNRGFANPAFDKIRAYLNRFGYEGYKNDLARMLTADFQVTVNMVNHLVDTRNKIAHGDLLATKTPADVRDMIRVIQAYCGATDTVFAAWCKANLCAIR
jgi:hypothetical protein